LQLQQLNLTPAQIRTAGGGAAQFSIATGNPLATVKQFDFEPFVQDDWRLRPNLLLSYGLRYEVQSNAANRLGFAPRLSIAWSPGATKSGQTPRTIVRSGGGIFYNRFGEASTLYANHFNGLNIQHLIFSESANPLVPTDPATLAILNSFHCVDGSATPNCVVNIPSLAGATPVNQTLWRVDRNLRVPTVYFFGAQIERQLPYKTVVTVGTSLRRIAHAINVRDVNAPIPGSITTTNPGGIRPNPALGEINQIEGAGRYNVSALQVNFRSRPNPRLSLNANYTLSKTMSDTDGQNSGEVPGVPNFPRDSYNRSGEWGPASVDVRHRFTLFGSYTAQKLWKLAFAPLLVLSSGPTFNITTGIDSNLDRQFTDRPSFAADNVNCALPFIRCTRFGNFNLIPAAGEKIIPRNFGRGTATVMFNLRLSRSFGFGKLDKTTTSSAAQRKYNLTMSVGFQNLFNRVNLATPVGNLSSPLFGTSQSLSSIAVSTGNPNAGNRRIFLNLQLGF
jgi:hypothetical protein